MMIVESIAEHILQVFGFFGPPDKPLISKPLIIAICGIALFYCGIMAIREKFISLGFTGLLLFFVGWGMILLGSTDSQPAGSPLLFVVAPAGIVGIIMAFFMAVMAISKKHYGGWTTLSLSLLSLIFISAALFVGAQIHVGL